MDFSFMAHFSIFFSLFLALRKTSENKEKQILSKFNLHSILE